MLKLFIRGLTNRKLIARRIRLNEITIENRRPSINLLLGVNVGDKVSTKSQRGSFRMAR